MLDHIRLQLCKEPSLDVKNDGPQLLLIGFRVLAEISRHRRTCQIQREITGIHQLPIVGDAPHFAGLNHHVPIGMQMANVVLQAAADFAPIAETNAGRFQHLAGAAALAHRFHPLGRVLARELVQLVVATA